MLLIKYEHCGTEWYDLYESAPDAECPECGKDIEALDWADPGYLFRCMTTVQMM